MNRLISLLLIFIGSYVFAASPAATQEWVRQYVATNQAPVFSFSISTNTGYATSVVTNEDGRVFEISHAMRDRIALVVSNCTHQSRLLGITNGTVFAHRGDGVFTNAIINRAIVSIGTNCLNFAGVNSTVTNGVDAVDGFFEIRGTRIDRPTAEDLNGEIRTSRLSPFDRAKRILAKAANKILDVLIPSARAETWGEYEAWVYKPFDWNESAGNFKYTVTDSKSGASYSITADDDGIDPTELNEVLKNLHLSTVSIVSDAIENIVPRINSIEKVIIEIDRQLEDLSVKLDTSIKGLSDRLKKIELEDEESGVSKKLNMKRSADGSTTYAGNGIFNVAGAQVDNLSIVSNDNGKISLRNFPQNAEGVGKYPFFSRDLKLDWNSPKDLVDGQTLVADVHPSYPNLVYKADDYHGIHLAGWHSPETNPNYCDLTLAHCLTSTNAQPHYVLTQLKNGKKLHYMNIGSLFASGGALRIIGTEGDVTIGKGTETNKITFASAADTNFRATVTKDGDNGVKVTFGVYWKP